MEVNMAGPPEPQHKPSAKTPRGRTTNPQLDTAHHAREQLPAGSSDKMRADRDTAKHSRKCNPCWLQLPPKLYKDWLKSRRGLDQPLRWQSLAQEEHCRRNLPQASSNAFVLPGGICHRGVTPSPEISPSSRLHSSTSDVLSPS